jgi:ankyrin repeat protein
MGNSLSPANSKISASDKAKLGCNQQLLTLAQFVEKKRWEAIIMFIKENPSITSVVCDPSNGQLCCHKAMMFDLPTDVIEALLATDASCLSVADSFGKYPIHYAMLHITDLINVVKTILQYDRSALSKTDIEGNLPLHLALSAYKAKEECLQLLIDSYSESTTIKTKQGKMTLHCALEFRSPLPIIKSLIEKNDKALRECYRGRLPLHIACEEKNPIENVRAVYEAYPEAAAFKGYEGMMPIHLCISSKVSQEIVSLLVHAHPEGLLHIFFLTIAPSLESD